jgi:hypothetical protein
MNLSYVSMVTATPSMLCEDCKLIGRNSSDLSDLMNVLSGCQQGNLIENIGGIFDNVWFPIPIDTDAAGSGPRLCPVVVHPTMGCGTYKFDYISFEIRGTETFRILVNGKTVIDWVIETNRTSQVNALGCQLDLWL